MAGEDLGVRVVIEAAAHVPNLGDWVECSHRLFHQQKLSLATAHEPVKQKCH